jgi:hypothetical protein
MLFEGSMIDVAWFVPKGVKLKKEFNIIKISCIIEIITEINAIIKCVPL